MKKNYIDINYIQVRPYGYSHPLANSFEYPCFESFDSRSDFIAFSEITNIAVKLHTENLMWNEGESYTPHLQHFEITLSKEGCNSPLFSTKLSLSLPQWVHFEDARIDIPFDSELIEENGNYEISVYRKGNRKPLCTAPLRFFHPETLPTKMFTATKGYFMKDEERFLNLSNSYLENCENPIYQAVFHLKRNKATEDERIPEFFLKVFYQDGREDRWPCNIEKQDDEIIVEASTFCSSGITYHELQVFGYNIAGMLINANIAEEAGEFTSDQLEPICDYVADDAALIYNDKRGPKESAFHAKETLQSLIGLNDVKDKLTRYTQLVHFNQQRSKVGLPSTLPPLHAMFLGSPGTGKTTVAKILGALLHEAGVLSKGHVVQCERATLLGQYYNSEAEKTLDMLEKAQGGILFIDEAYQLYQPQDGRDPGRFVIETLMTALADESNRDWMLVLAGYSEPMLKMYEMNPGLSSRIPRSNHYVFSDFGPNELTDIATHYFEANNYQLTPEALTAVSNLMQADYNNRGKDFGNARHVINIIQTGIIPAMANRLADMKSPTREQLCLIEACDIPSSTIPSVTPRQRIGFSIR